MFRTLTKYKASAIALGLVGLVAFGEDSPASNSDHVVGPKTRFVGSNHKAITRDALTGRLNDLAVRALVETSTIGDDDPVANARSGTHFDNCYYYEGVEWIRSNRQDAVAAANQYHRTRSEQDRQAVFRHLGYVIHATEDFYSHSNWADERATITICNFDDPKPEGWYSGRWSDHPGDGDKGCLCEAGSPWHSMAGLGMSKDDSDRVGYPGSFKRAYDDAVLAVRDQINEFKNLVDNTTLMELGFLHSINFTPISDAFQFDDGRTYFFMGRNYLRYNMTSDQVDSGYPKSIGGNWPGVWPDGVDAALNWNNGKVYFFRGSQYIRYDMASDCADPGYPKSIAGNWPGLWTSGIDAAIMWNNGKAYFFKDSEYIRYDIASDRADEGYPKPIAGNWPGLWPAGVDGAARFEKGSFGQGKAYFFRGKDYIRYDIAADRADEGYPKPTVSNWKGL